MKKLFTLIAGLALAAAANASTGYKCLYTEANVYPAGAGEVYLYVRDEEHPEYIKDISADYDPESAFLKAVIDIQGGWGPEDDEGNGKVEDCTNGVSHDALRAIIYAMPYDGYELVCYANAIQEDGIYGRKDCFAVLHEYSGESPEKVMDWEYTGAGDMINVNNPDHPENANSDKDDPNKPMPEDCVLDEYNDLWNESPDCVVYVIFREEGAEYPMFDADFEGHADENSVGRLVMNSKTEGTYYNAAGQAVGYARGIIIKDGKKYLNK